MLANGSTVTEIIDHDLSFSPFRKRQNNDHTNMYERARAQLIEKQLQDQLLISKKFGDRRLMYLRCRESILSNMYPERNKSMFPRTVRNPKNTPSTPVPASTPVKNEVVPKQISTPTQPQPGIKKNISTPNTSNTNKNIKSSSNVNTTPSTNPPISTPIHSETVPQSPAPSTTTTTTTTTPTTATTTIKRKDSSIEKKLPSINDPAGSVEYYQFAGMHHVFNHNKKAVNRVKFGRQSRDLVAFASVDNTLSVVNLFDTPPSTSILKGHKRGVSDFDWSMTNDFILSSSIDETLRVWNVKNSSCLRCIEVGAAVFCCCFHPINNNVIFAGTSSMFIELYNFSTGKELLSLAIDSPAKSIIFSNDGMILFVGCSDGKIRWFKCTNPLKAGTNLLSSEASLVWTTRGPRFCT
eukprot:TRINITY_DN7221_c0_g1_i2.p1 TRINITY_DN7221_c0_g1~~TRINITY_DN7221_c0_g1_i2.p1  ORF type:complete len:409 (-),score=70.06 TRINITY_DN7221_c0_g1_i2:4-1230(-)